MAKVFISRQVIGLEQYADQFELDVWAGSMPPSAPELRERTHGCAGLVSMLTDRLDTDFLDAMPDLKVISQYAVGVNNIDLDAAKKRGIPVGHTPDVLTDATADMAFALMLCAARNLIPGYDYVKAGQWKTWDPTLLLGQAAWGATLGVIGYGRIGRAMAARGKGFNMRVLVVAPHLSDADAARDHVSRVSLDDLLRDSDFVSIHTPLRPETKHLIGSRELSLMKLTATLINTARGEIVDNTALVDALKAGRPGSAALDVTEPEPLPPDHPLLNQPNCVVVPHLGSATMQARLGMTQIAMANLAAGLSGEPLPHRANP